MNKVIVIGGGIAGMYAAERLAEQGFSVVLVEVKDRLGGRIETYYRKEVFMEKGAARFNRFHHRLLGLLKKYNLHTVPITGKKHYRPVLCNTPDMGVDTLLRKVVKYAENVSPRLLKKITFGQLCEIALGYEKTKFLIEAFGYNAEFLVANAYASIPIFQEDFKPGVEYYLCMEGLSELINRMEQNLLRLGVHILKMYSLKNFTWMDTEFKVALYNMVEDKEVHLRCSHLVLAIPRNDLVQQPFMAPYKPLLESVSAIPLHRIYAKYKKPWTKDIPRTTTDIQLRQFIPVDAANGVVMVSYSDMFDAEYWKIYADMGGDTLEEALQKQLKVLFPQKQISKAEWIQSFFWKDGVHCWNAGVDPTQVRKELQKIHPNLHIVGESYSLHQGWIEGALETVHEIKIKPQKGGLSTEFMNYKEWVKTLPKTGITQAHLDESKKRFPAFKWILLRLPGEKMTRWIDVTQWVDKHPGGRNVLEEHKYKKVEHTTKDFLNIGSHIASEENGVKILKPFVKSMIEKYTVGWIQ